MRRGGIVGWSGGRGRSLMVGKEREMEGGVKAQDRAPNAAQHAAIAKWCAADPGPSFLSEANRGPGSAAHRHQRVYARLRRAMALRSARDTQPLHPTGLSSAITLPSFGSEPGATSMTTPLSLVIDCKVAATEPSSDGSGAAHSATSVIVSC